MTQPTGGRLARSAALVAALTAGSQLLGFVRDAVIAAVFGATAAVDAYLVAQGVMNLVLGLLAGAVAKALVPPLSRAVEAGEPERAHRTVRVALTVTVSVLVCASAVVAVAAEPVLAVLAPGFDDRTAELAVRLTRVVLVATVFVAGTNVLAAAAQAHRRFFWAGVQGVPFNLVMIAAAGLFGARYGVTALAVGFVVGSAARFAVQLPAVRSIGCSLRPSLRLRDSGFREVVRMVPPLLVGSAVTNVNTLVDRAVGSGGSEGTIAALNYGWRLVGLADTLLVAAAVTALYPALGAVGGAERRGELRELVRRSTGVALVALTPVAVVLAVAAGPVVELVIGRGAFDERAVRLTALAVAWYAAALVALGVRELAARACYAVGDTVTPARVAVLGMAVNVAGDLTAGRAYGVPGLAGSTTVAAFVTAAALVLALQRRHDAIRLRELVPGAVRVLAATAAAAGIAVLLPLPGTAGTLGAAVELGVTGAVVLSSYLGILALTRSRELAEAVGIARRALPAGRERTR